jgi:class 3 adenylate cyclase
MITSEEIIKEVNNIFSSKWETREGRIVPEPEDLKLINDAVLLNGVVLYADLRASTEMVNKYENWFSAEIYKSYLVSVCKIIQDNEGKITAFDGDRVMAVYIGTSKNSSAAKTALKVNYVISKINEVINEKYPQKAYNIKQAVGIDNSALFVARTGIRKYNDLIWVGRAANYAAKLCSIKNTEYKTYITESVFNALSNETKNGGDPERCMWNKIYWEERDIYIYGSSWWWKI